MFNNAPINDLLINENSLPAEQPTGILSLGSFDFCDAYLGFNSDDLWSSGEIALDISPNSQQNGGRLLQQLLTEKRVNMNVVLGASSKEELQGKIDALKAAVYVKETELYNLWNGEYRALKVTTSGVIGVTWRSNYSAEVNFELFANNPPNWYSKDPVTKSFLGLVGDLSFTVNNMGTMESYGKYYFVFGGSTSLTGLNFVLNGFTATITTNIVAGDVIVIDTAAATVMKNGTLIGARGPLTMPLEKGLNTLQADFVGGVVYCDLTIVYYKNYI